MVSEKRPFLHWRPPWHRHPSFEKQAEIEKLAQAIHEAVEGEIHGLTPNLATRDDAHLFCANEFQIRALAQ